MSTDTYSLNDKWSVATIRDETNSLSLRYGVYQPEAGVAADRFVILLNGRTEYLEKYNYFVEDLKLPGNCHLLTNDHRGQGASGGARGHIETYDVFCRDIARIIEKVVRSRPYIIISHSMGGLIALYGSLEGFFQPAKMLSFSPLFGLRDDPMPRKLARILSSGISGLGVGHISAHFGQNNKTAFEINKLTHSIERYTRIQNAPHQIPSVTFGWVFATFCAIDKIFEADTARNLGCDISIIGSPNDQVVDPTAWHRWVNFAAPLTEKRIEFELEHGARHELLSEIPKYYDHALAESRKVIMSWGQ
jgi:alpha-beta hydrolase superfamily lysophospholipase